MRCDVDMEYGDRRENIYLGWDHQVGVEEHRSVVVLCGVSESAVSRGNWHDHCKQRLERMLEKRDGQNENRLGVLESLMIACHHWRKNHQANHANCLEKNQIGSEGVAVQGRDAM